MLLLLLHVILFVCLSNGWWFLWVLLLVYLFIYAKVLSFIHVNISIIVLLKEMWLSCTENDQKLGWPSIYIYARVELFFQIRSSHLAAICTLSLIVHVHWVVSFDPFHLLSVVSWSSLGYWGGTSFMWLKGWRTQKTCTWGTSWFNSSSCCIYLVFLVIHAHYGSKHFPWCRKIGQVLGSVFVPRQSLVTSKS